MALIRSDSCCAICNKALDRPFTATSGLAFGPDHFLWHYCDAPLHLDCLETWPHREEFSRAYFDRDLRNQRTGTGTLLKVGDSWFFACGPLVLDQQISRLFGWPLGEPHCAYVCLAQWPIRLYSPWRAWEDFVAAGFREDLVGAALDAAERIMVQVRALAPTFQALRDLRVRRVAERSPYIH